MSQQFTYLSGYPRYYLLWRKYAERTMVPRKWFLGNLFVVDHHMKRQGLDRGCFVECGTWRGGMAFAISELAAAIGECHFYDSFEGLPPAGPHDGELAHREQADDTLWHDNNTADYGDFMRGAKALERPDRKIVVHKGWFEDTLPEFESDRPISILRLDGDWYQSTLCILENLFDRVMPGGLIIVDDYFDWDGCSRAVHDFLSACKARERLCQSPFGGVAYMIKACPEHDSDS